MPIQYSTSAALRFTELELGGPCEERYKQVIIGVNTPAIAAPQNPDRVGLIVVNLSTSDAFLNLTPGDNPGSGILLTALGGNVAMNVREDFTIPSREWTVSTAGITTIGVFEIVRFAYNQETN